MQPNHFSTNTVGKTDKHKVTIRYLQFWQHWIRYHYGIACLKLLDRLHGTNFKKKCYVSKLKSTILKKCKIRYLLHKKILFL